MSTTGLQYILLKVFQAITMNRGKTMFMLAIGIFRSLIKYSWSVLFMLSICYNQWTKAATVKNTSSTQFVTSKN